MAFNQQGDLLLKRVGETLHNGQTFTSIPKEAKRREDTPQARVLAEGEATGHAHRVEGDVELYELGTRVFMRVLEGNVSVIHEEHGAQTLEPGEYEIERVQEFDPFAEVARNVAD